VKVEELSPTTHLAFTRGTGPLTNEKVWALNDLVMEIFTRANIQREKSTDKENMSGCQESTMRDSGSWAIRMAMASGKDLLVTPTLVNGATISLMDLESIFGEMATSMKESGRLV
jgi:hypothetical protein